MSDLKSPSMALVKTVASLSQKKYREQHQAILVEGLHPIEEAIRAGLKLQHAFVCSSESQIPLFQIEPYIVDAVTMQRMATTDSPPPCLAVFERPAVKEISPLAVDMSQKSLILVLDGLQDPGNLGTLIRSAVAFGVDAIVLTEDSTEFYSPKVIRASAGLVFAIPITVQSRKSLLDDLTEWTVYGTFGSTWDNGERPVQSYREVDYTSSCVILLGNEAHGLSPELKSYPRLCPLTVPMAETVESLNVAISGSIILSEAAAQRGLIVV